MTKTIITQDNSGSVTIEYDHRDGDHRVSRTFSCSATGGYVRERDQEGHYPQVCERLYSWGNTLMAADRTHLLEVIRREYRAMRRAEQREAA